MKVLQHLIGSLFVFLTITSSSQTYFLNGSAANLGGDCYAVTPAANFQNGTVWSADQINLSESFDIEFLMNFGSIDANGADGMVFVLQQIGTGAVGINGSGMGYQGFNTSFGIEFDTYTNSADPTTGQNMNDPIFDHVAFLRNGDVNHASANNLAGPVQASATNINIEDNTNHNIRITWDPATMLVELYFDCNLRLSATVDLLGTIFTNNDMVYFGFTGSTGGLNNLQTVCLQENLIPSPESVSICPGETIQLNAGGDSNGTFSWSPTTGLDDATIQTPVASPDVTTTYTVSTYSVCGDLIQQTFEVIVLPVPAVNAGPDDVFCENDTYTLQATVASAMAYAWTTDDGQFDSGVNSLNPVISTPGTYTLSVTSPNGCVNSDDVIITETALPTVDLGEDVLICENETTVLTLSGTYDNIVWSTGETASSITVPAGNYSVEVTTDNCSATDDISITEEILPTIDLGNDVTICETTTLTLDAGVVVNWQDGSSAQTYEVEMPGIYVATFTSNGCSVSDYIEVMIDAVPEFSLGADQLICEGESITLNTPSSAIWSTGETGTSITVSAPGFYSAIIQQGACDFSDVVSIFQEIAPTVDLGVDPTICLGRELVLSAMDDNITTYTWSNGDTSHQISPNTSGEYSVVVENQCGSASDTVLVTFEECDYFIYAPNAFTPDDDGINDVWSASTFKIDSFEILIYDRWGDIVFTSTDPNAVWMGNKNGGEYYQQTEIFNFLIKYTANTTEAQYLRGHIALIR